MLTRRAVVALLFIVSWVMYLDRAAISVAKELIQGDLALTDQAAGLVFGAFALGYAIAQVPAGAFADRFGPRVALAAVVAGWSAFTALTGAASGLWTLVAVRFAFGVAEAGAFPGSARVLFNWLPSAQHGRANGIIFSGSRLGAAFSFPLLAWLMSHLGWRASFVALAVPGILWAGVWLLWFRDEPLKSISRQPRQAASGPGFAAVFRSRRMLLAMAQYFASNFTFFICLSWMHPYLMREYRLPREEAAWYSMIVLLVGATAQWVAGFSVDRLYHSPWREHSRRAPAMLGFMLSAAGLFLLAGASSVHAAVAAFTVATFGAEMTISPSWAFCIDVGGKNSGAVSGSMNMVGNFGSFVSASVFPFLYQWTGGSAAYFLAAGVLNICAASAWMGMRSQTGGEVPKPA